MEPRDVSWGDHEGVVRLKIAIGPLCCGGLVAGGGARRVDRALVEDVRRYAEAAGDSFHQSRSAVLLAPHLEGNLAKHAPIGGLCLSVPTCLDAEGVGTGRKLGE